MINEEIKSLIALHRSCTEKTKYIWCITELWILVLAIKSLIIFCKTLDENIWISVAFDYDFWVNTNCLSGWVTRFFLNNSLKRNYKFLKFIRTGKKPKGNLFFIIVQREYNIRNIVLWNSDNILYGENLYAQSYHHKNQ